MKTEFYRMEYEAWDEGTDSLSLEQEGAYLRLCHQMYRRRGPIPNQPNMLARIWRCHPNKASALLRQLIDAGKVSVDSQGSLTQVRVMCELDHRGVRSTQAADNGHRGGIQRAQNAANLLKQQDGDQADASRVAMAGQAIREEKSREEKKDSIAAAMRPPNPDFEKLWAIYPKREGGNPKKPARKVYDALIKAGVTPDQLMASVRDYAKLEAKNIGTRFIQRTETFFNQWSIDDIPTQQAGAVMLTYPSKRWNAWRSYYEFRGKKFTMDVMDEHAALSKPFPVPTDMPPPELQAAMAA